MLLPAKVLVVGADAAELARASDRRREDGLRRLSRPVFHCLSPVPKLGEHDSDRFSAVPRFIDDVLRNIASQKPVDQFMNMPTCSARLPEVAGAVNCHQRRAVAPCVVVAHVIASIRFSSRLAFFANTAFSRRR